MQKLLNYWNSFPIILQVVTSL